MMEPSPETMKDFDRLFFKCEKKECIFENTYEKAINHLTTCNVSFQECIQGCGYAVLGKDMEYHCIA